MSDKRLTICVVGLKGAVFLEGILAKGVQPNRIISYDQPDDKACSFSKIRELAERSGAEFLDQKRPVLLEEELSFFVGWQFLVKSPGPYTVVFHDSMLPRYRGFAPTVTALINGDREIGVTALSPNDGVDEGEIIDQKAVLISYPMTIARALELQAVLMAGLAIDIHARWLNGHFVTRKQDHSLATYSIWRDEKDHIIDWSRPAVEILRFIHAVGHPYAGARTFAGGVEVIIDDATLVDDLRFEQRHCGKIWQLDAGRPIVICGCGLLRLDAIRKDGESFQLRKLRQRLG